MCSNRFLLYSLNIRSKYHWRFCWKSGSKIIIIICIQSNLSFRFVAIIPLVARLVSYYHIIYIPNHDFWLNRKRNRTYFCSSSSQSRCIRCWQHADCRSLSFIDLNYNGIFWPDFGDRVKKMWEKKEDLPIHVFFYVFFMRSLYARLHLFPFFICFSL